MIGIRVMLLRGNPKIFISLRLSYHWTINLDIKNEKTIGAKNVKVKNKISNKSDCPGYKNSVKVQSVFIATKKATKEDTNVMIPIKCISILFLMLRWELHSYISANGYSASPLCQLGGHWSKSQRTTLSTMSEYSGSAGKSFIRIFICSCSPAAA